MTWSMNLVFNRKTAYAFDRIPGAPLITPPGLSPELMVHLVFLQTIRNINLEMPKF